MRKKVSGDRLYLLNRQRKIKINLKNLEPRARKALKRAGLDLKSLGIIFVSNRRIAGYHKKYLGRTGATDVISFKTGRGQGELIISAEAAHTQAKEYHHSLESEMLVLIVHGFLHLAGYRDYRPAERRRMEGETERILAGVEEPDE